MRYAPDPIQPTAFRTVSRPGGPRRLRRRLCGHQTALPMEPIHERRARYPIEIALRATPSLVQVLQGSMEFSQKKESQVCQFILHGGLNVCSLDQGHPFFKLSGPWIESESLKPTQWPPQPHPGFPQAHYVTAAWGGCPTHALHGRITRRLRCLLTSEKDPYWVSAITKRPTGRSTRCATVGRVGGEPVIERVAHPFKVRAPQPSSTPVSRPTANQNRVTCGLQFSNASLCS
jgi:hypothetical protein